jgi:hypothetical protein
MRDKMRSRKALPGAIIRKGITRSSLSKSSALREVGTCARIEKLIRGGHDLELWLKSARLRRLGSLLRRNCCVA